MAVKRRHSDRQSHKHTEKMNVFPRSFMSGGSHESPHPAVTYFPCSICSGWTSAVNLLNSLEDLSSPKVTSGFGDEETGALVGGETSSTKHRLDCTA